MSPLCVYLCMKPCFCDFSFSYKSAENQKILSRLVDEVKGLNSRFITQHIRGQFDIVSPIVWALCSPPHTHMHVYGIPPLTLAQVPFPPIANGSQSTCLYNYMYVVCSIYTDAAYRYYRSRCEENSASRRGLSAINQKKKRRHERIARVSYNCHSPSS